MTITVGSTPVQAIYVGSTPIQEVYVGSTKIWPSAPAEQWTRWVESGFRPTYVCTSVRNPDPATGNWVIYDTDHVSTFTFVTRVVYGEDGNVATIYYEDIMGRETEANFDSVEN